MAAKNPLYAFLHEKTIAEIVEDQEIVTLKDTDILENAVKIMSSKHIISLPVVNGEGECIGLVDTLDMVAFIAAVAPRDEEVTADMLSRLEMFGRVIHLETVKDVMDFSGRDPYVPVSTHNQASMALDYFAMGIHRVPVLDDNGKITHTLSQSSVNRTLAPEIKRGHLGEFSSQTIDSLGLARCELVSVGATDTVLDAIRKMGDEKVSALAVTDTDGKLAGNLSASTFRGLFKDKLPSLLSEVRDFLEDHSPKSANPICVRPESTFAEVVEQIAENRIHRVWVIDDDYKPVGVVSLTDIMRTIKDADFAV